MLAIHFHLSAVRDIAEYYIMSLGFICIVVIIIPSSKRNLFEILGKSLIKFERFLNGIIYIFDFRGGWNSANLTVYLCK